jgi:hypothetical protein
MRRPIFLLLPALAACQDAGVTKFNSPPTASITSHRTGDTVREGYSETLTGIVGDPNHDLEDLLVDWVVDGTTVCPAVAVAPTGAVSCDTLFGVGGGAVQLIVSDPEGESAQDRVDLTVAATDAPTAEITAPTETGVYYSDQLITFAGLVGDGEDAPEDLVVSWETDGLGDLGLTIDVTSAGEVEAFGNLAEGEHAVRLRAVDTSSKEATDSVVITVGPPNTAPSCGITSPADGEAGPEGGEVRFEGSVADVDVAADWLGVTWTSDVDGTLRESTPDSDGTVGFAYTDLTVATHRITLTATDEVGATCTDSIYYTVGTPPELIVTAPLDGDVVNEGDTVAFAATVADNEDLPTEIDLSWWSDLDGEFSNQGADSTGAIAFSYSALGPGSHGLRVTATDTDGLYTVATLNLNVNAVPTAPTVAITPDPAITSDSLTANASGSVDPDSSGTVTYSYAWYENGVLSSASTSAVFPPSDTVKHSSYRVVVTPDDGTGSGPTGEATLTVSNADPSLTGPTLSASSVTVGDVLTCAASATDVDGDSVTLTYTWSDGSTGTTYAVTDADDPGDAITCTVVADDGDGGTATASASASVDNTDPVLTGVTVDPSTAQVGDLLTCSGTATDADGGTPSLSYAWSGGGSGSTYTVVDTDDPGDVITCTMTATDTDGGSATGSATASIINTDPTVDTVSISPSSATNDDTLTCSATSSDADGGTPSISYSWDNLTTGGSLGAGATLDLSVVAVFSADTVQCTATAADTDGGSGTGTATLTVDNRAPTLSVVLTPASASSSETLTCVAAPADDDGDSLTTTFAWDVGGTTVAATSTSGLTSTLAGAFSAGDTVTCTATTSDGKGGTASDSASSSITNDAPVVSGVTLLPSTARTNNTLTASATTSDPDGDPLTVTYSFYVGGSLVQAGSSTTLSGITHFDKHESVYVAVSAYDGTDTTTVNSATVVIDNTPPGAPVVSITPTSPTAGDTLVCNIDTPSNDDDSDTVTYTMAWEVDGVAYVAGGTTDTGGLDSGDPGWLGPSTTTWTDDTVDGADVGSAETWTCTATPNDGDDDGTAGSATTLTEDEYEDFVIFVTNTFLGSSSGSWLSNRAAADAHCASYASSSGISGSNFKIMYSTPSEDAKDYVGYDASRGDRVFDRNGTQVDGGNVWAMSTRLPNQQSWTIVSTGTSGTFQGCSGSYPSGSWPICQYCSKKFACGSSAVAPFRPNACCWTGTRAIVCMGEL